ncbi:MAG TPA: OsmC family protein [Polyangiaceae bacterium]|nr:OsmC family protein [Polyangiaceae bacterium]
MISMVVVSGAGVCQNLEPRPRILGGHRRGAQHVVDIYLEYQGDLHCRAQHGPSSAELVTDAPVDNHGRGAAFSPTDLVATGLGSCMATVMGILARKRGYALEGTRVHVKKTMTGSGPRRIAQLAVDVTLPKAATDSVGNCRAELEQVARECPVRLSLLDAIDVPLVFEWQR